MSEAVAENENTPFRVNIGIITSDRDRFVEVEEAMLFAV